MLDQADVHCSRPLVVARFARRNGFIMTSLSLFSNSDCWLLASLLTIIHGDRAFDELSRYASLRQGSFPSRRSRETRLFLRRSAVAVRKARRIRAHSSFLFLL
nr:hypothetical protein CFP56_08047 [Quercus suber]